MDLITAKVEAAKLSREKRTQVYVNLTDDEEVEVSEEAGKDVLHIFVNGSEVSEQAVEEVKIPAQKTKSKTKTKSNMSTKKSPKKQAKKTAVKKAESVVKNTASKSTSKSSSGQQTMPVKAIREKMNKGFYALNKDGKNLTPKYLEGMADQSREMVVTFKPKTV